MTLTQALVHELLDADYEAGTLTWRKRPDNPEFNTQYAGKPAFATINGQGYKQGSINGTIYNAHRVIFLHYHGWLPPEVDHENGDITDNRIANLRPADRKINMRNMKKRRDNTTGETSITWDVKAEKWSVLITHNNRRHFVGRFEDIEDAIRARDYKRKELGGFTSRHGT